MPNTFYRIKRQDKVIIKSEMNVRRQGTENQGTDVGTVLAAVWVVLGG